MSDYNKELHQEQERIRVEREKVYSRAVGETCVWDEEETEWLFAALYKLMRVKNHTRIKAKALDDLTDAANYIGLIYHKLYEEGNRPSTSEELAAKDPCNLKTAGVPFTCGEEIPAKYLPGRKP